MYNVSMYLQSQEIQDFIPLLNQLIAKYKERISPFLQNVFMPVVQTIITCLNQPFDHNDMEVSECKSVLNVGVLIVRTNMYWKDYMCCASRMAIVCN